MGKNVDISGCHIPGRLKKLRERHKLTLADLAERAGLSYRTVLDLERGRRERVQAKTLMLLAEALSVDYEDFIVPETPEEASARAVAPGRLRVGHWVGIALVGLVITAALVGLTRLEPAQFELDRGLQRLIARDDLIGRRIWSRSFGDRIRFCEISPRNKNVVLVGLFGDQVEGGYMAGLDRATGRTLWRVRPDLDALAAAFGEDAYSANYSCSHLTSPDLDGDGEPEIVVRFCHASLYPNALCFVGPGGELESQYASRGHIAGLHVVDLDRDGKDELVAYGTNNCTDYQGATVLVLDERHRSGATVDAACPAVVAAVDSALVRLVLPKFPDPYMERMGARRSEVKQLKSHVRQDGRIGLVATVSVNREDVLFVELDDALHPLSCGVLDAFLGRVEKEGWPPELINGTGPPDPAWREAWLARHVRFEVGRLDGGSDEAIPGAR